MSARFASFDPNNLSPEARAVYDRILNDRGYVPGPYQFWLASPGFSDRIEPVEKFLRHGVSLEERLVEIVVLVVVVVLVATENYWTRSLLETVYKERTLLHVCESFRENYWLTHCRRLRSERQAVMPEPRFWAIEEEGAFLHHLLMQLHLLRQVVRDSI